jgi:uncharacterized protein YecT (DUF1311 family)
MCRTLKVLITLAAISFSTFGLAQDCEPASPQLHDACIASAKSEATLNATYQRILQMLDTQAKENPSRVQVKTALIEAQKRWAKFREADCNAVQYMYAGGSGAFAFGVECGAAHAKERTNELEDQFIPHN